MKLKSWTLDSLAMFPPPIVLASSILVTAICSVRRSDVVRSSQSYSLRRQVNRSSDQHLITMWSTSSPSSLLKNIISLRPCRHQQDQMMQDWDLVFMSKWNGALFHLDKKKQKAFLSPGPIFYISLQMWKMSLMARYLGKTRTITGVADSDVVAVITIQSSEHIETCNAGCFLLIGPRHFQHRREKDLWPTQVLTMEFSI